MVLAAGGCGAAVREWRYRGRVGGGGNRFTVLFSQQNGDVHAPAVRRRAGRVKPQCMLELSHAFFLPSFVVVRRFHGASVLRCPRSPGYITFIAARRPANVSAAARTSKIV